ncbi:hypothetical protein [Promicromonospora xylanilytica]
MTDWAALIRDDPDKAARELHRGAERGLAVAAARPGFAEVGEALTKLHTALVASMWVGEFPLVEGSVLVPRRGARGDSWDRTCINVNGDNRLVLEVADGYATAVRDHVLGLGRVAEAGGPSRSLLALARVLLDASVHLDFLLNDSIDERERCLRAANIRLEALRQEVADARDDVEERNDAEGERDLLIAAALKDGFERGTMTDKKTGKQKETWFLHPRHRLDDVLRDAVGGGHQDSWRVLSSAVHAQERPVLRFALGLGRVSAGPHANSMVIAHLMIPIILATEAIKVVESYYGPAGPPVDQGIVNRALEIGSFAAGMRDEEIRRHLGFDQ